MRTAILLSGGMDSMVLLAYLSNQRQTPRIAIGFDYGQRHVKELEFAERIANHYRVINFARLPMPHIPGSALTGSGEIPRGHYEAPDQKATVVPNRNMLMLATACSRMVGCDYEAIYFAAHAGDAAIYPDCRRDFVEATDKAMQLSCGIAIRAPFIGYTKRDIGSLARTLGVPLQMSWSCYEGGDAPCGKCGACVEREEAMA